MKREGYSDALAELGARKGGFGCEHQRSVRVVSERLSEKISERQHQVGVTYEVHRIKETDYRPLISGVTARG